MGIMWFDKDANNYLRFCCDKVLKLNNLQGLAIMK